VPVLVVLLILLLAVFLWRHSANRKAVAPQLRARAVGPDDDPDFLRELSRRPREEDDLP
jgi:hypothetical protein